MPHPYNEAARRRSLIPLRHDDTDPTRPQVHCAMGISRSATVVSAYLVATTLMHPHEAIEFVQSKREIVCPNLGFRRQLDVYASRLRGTRKLRKLVPPPIRATITYSSILADGFRRLRPPEPQPVRFRPPEPQPMRSRPHPPSSPSTARTRRGPMG